MSEELWYLEKRVEPQESFIILFLLLNAPNLQIVVSGDGKVIED